MWCKMYVTKVQCVCVCVCVLYSLTLSCSVSMVKALFVLVPPASTVLGDTQQHPYT